MTMEDKQAQDQMPSCFCVQELEQSKHIIAAIREQLPLIRMQLDLNKSAASKERHAALAELQKTVRQLWDIFPMLIQQLHEYGDSDLVELAQKLHVSLRRYDYLGTVDYTPLCSALAAFEKQIPAEGNAINAAALGHLMNHVKMGYFPTDPEHVERLRKAVVFPSESVNLLDPCCGEGLALTQFAAGSKTATYGVEIDDLRAAEAQNRLGRVAFGSFFHSVISPRSFQCLFLNPPYLTAPSEYGRRRLEKSFLADSLRLLADGGLLIYIIPHHRATPDICRILCEYFDRLSVYRFTGKEYERFRQTVFLGQRIPWRSAGKKAEKLTEYMLHPENIPPVTELPEGAYPLVPAAKPVETFKGAVFNVQELAEQFKKSKSLQVLFSASMLDMHKHKPPLPLNLSQIGLVGASGLMNGLIACETPHVIKGRIVKEKKTEVISLQDKTAEVREITSNKLIFNILTPQGFLSLS